MKICEEEGHQYTIASKDYYKLLDKSFGSLGPYDQSVSYATLFCERCGETKEIVSQRHKK